MSYSLFWAASVALLAPFPALALSWEDAIAATEARSEELWSLADERGLLSHHLGTAYNELHVNEHRCSILGRMLDKADLIGDIEKSTEFDIPHASADETALAALSLSNWVYSAKALLDTDESKRIREWNLDCVGHLGIPKIAYIGEKSAATFYEIDKDVLRIMGDVEPQFANKLRAAVLENPQVTTIALGSGGGSVVEALQAGYFIRSMGLNTTLWNNCYSACTMVFIGGVNRQVWSPYPELSFHQVSRDGVPVPVNDEIYYHIARYVVAMGVNMDVFMGLMMSAHPSSFTTPAAVDLCGSRIATWVQRLC